MRLFHEWHESVVADVSVNGVSSSFYSEFRTNIVYERPSRRCVTAKDFSSMPASLVTVTGIILCLCLGRRSREVYASDYFWKGGLSHDIEN